MFYQLISCVLAVTIALAAAQQKCEGKYQCIESAECLGGKCVCQAPFVWGDGTFACYRQNAVAAESKNDPRLTNFNNESLPFPYPCRYLLTHVRQELKDNDRNVIGNCEFKVSAFNAKAKGKFFTHGFDVAVCINYDDGRKVKLSSRNYGLARSGVYTFERQGTTGEFLPDGPWGDDDIQWRDRDNGLRVQITENDYNNQLVFDFRRCGLTVTFVPYDIEARRNQQSVPGLSVAINCANHPQWYSPDMVMGLSPVMDGGAKFEDIRLPGLDEEASVFVRAFTQRFTQNQPYDDMGRCDATSSTIGKCNPAERRKAIDNCFWMMKQPRFVRCFDRTMSAKKLLMLFASCVDMWCANGSCADVMKSIADSGCSTVRNIRELEMFMAGRMCPP